MRPKIYLLQLGLSEYIPILDTQDRIYNFSIYFYFNLKNNFHFNFKTIKISFIIHFLTIICRHLWSYLFIFGGSRGSNSVPCIFYALFIPNKLSSQGPPVVVYQYFDHRRLILFFTIIHFFNIT